MEMQLGTATSMSPATAVGHAFVNQYYNVLLQSPQVVHQFYTDSSKLSRAGPSGIIDTIEEEASIHEKIMSLDYGDISTQIKSIDSQASLGGSVLVMVTGTFLTRTRTKRNFVQTFFLAPQDRGGYFVLNDICRYLDENFETEQAVTSAAPLSNGAFEQPAFVPSVPLDHECDTIEHEEPIREEHSHAEHHYDLPDQVDTTEIQDEIVEVPTIPHEAAAAAPSEHVVSPKEVIAAPEPKKSYASILRSAKEPSVVPVTSQPKAFVPHVERSAPLSIPATQPSYGLTTVADQFDEGQHMEEGDGQSIYVKNLSTNITIIELEEEFRKFGRIKLDGISIRNPKPGVCFAFIDYDEVGAAQSAIEASPLVLGGRQAYVEERRSITSRGGRGRGRGYLNEGARGRGNFGSRGSARGSIQEGNRGRIGRGGYGGISRR